MSFVLKKLLPKIAKVSAPLAVPIVTKVGIPLVGAKLVKDRIEEYMPYIIGGSVIASLAVLYIVVK
jgi:hypothetical protein